MIFWGGGAQMKSALDVAALPINFGIVGVTVVCVASGWLVIGDHQSLKTSLQKRDALQFQLAGRLSTVERPSGDFSSSWPEPPTGALVVSDLGRYAQAHEIKLGSLSVQRQPVAAREVGYERYTVSLSGTYPNLKLWLHEVQQRHPSLAVENLVVRSLSNDAGRQEASLSLVLYTQ